MTVDMQRVLPKRDRNRVASRLRAWAATHQMVNMPMPDLMEVRWSDDYSLVRINRESGLPAYFDSLFHEHGPVEEGQHHATYDTGNPGARALLEAIREVTEQAWRG